MATKKAAAAAPAAPAAKSKESHVEEFARRTGRGMAEPVTFADLHQMERHGVLASTKMEK